MHIPEQPTYIAYCPRAASMLTQSEVLIRNGRHTDARPMITEARALIREKRVYGTEYRG